MSSTAVIKIAGVVVAESLRAMAEHEGNFTIAFVLEPWRIAGGPLQAKKLNAMWTHTPPAKLDERRSALVPGAALRFAVHLKEPMPGFYNAEVVSVLGPVSGDAELQKSSAVATAALVVEEPFFGRLELDVNVHTYTGVRGDFRMWTPLVGEPLRAPETVIAAAQWFDAERPAILEAIAKSLLSVANGSWRAEGPKKTKEEFLSAVSLERVAFHEDGSIVAFFSAGEVFAGHSIELHIDRNRRIGRATVAG